MKKLLLAAGAMFCLSACTSTELARVQSYQDKIAAVCVDAMVVAPAVPAVGEYIMAACTANGIAKLALDPSSLVWLQGLIAKARAA